MLQHGWSSQHEHVGHRPQGFHAFAASEINPQAREALLQQRHDRAPEHVFGDVVKRLPPRLESEARRVTSEALAVSSGDPMADSLKLVRELRVLLEGCSFQSANWCYKHQTACALCPPKPVSKRPQPLHMEVAGVTCTPWSSMNLGKYLKWHNAATLPCIVLSEHLLAIQPSIIIIENVRAFDVPTFVSRFLEQNRYKHCVLPLSPLEVGVPTGRARKFLICLNVAHFCDLMTMTLNPEPLMQSVFHRRLAATVAVFSQVASEKEVLVWKAEMLQQKGWSCFLQGHESGEGMLKSFPARKCLPGASHQRLQAYQAEYSKEQAEEGVHLECCWIDLNQCLHFYRRMADTAPPLLSTSKLWNLTKKQPVTLPELLVCLGFAPPVASSGL